jgi:hypothetical protein
MMRKKFDTKGNNREYRKGLLEDSEVSSKNETLYIRCDIHKICHV